MYGKNHTKEALALISKPGELNPVSPKRHCEETKILISKKMSKYPSGIGLYDLDDNLILKFNNNVELAKHLNISRVTVGKYLNKGLIYLGKYRFKIIQI
jgi:group I intron endonuclease